MYVDSSHTLLYDLPLKADIRADSAWDREPASTLAKETIWRLHGNRYALALRGLLDLARQTPYHEAKDLSDHAHYNQARRKAWEQFRDLPMFFVKVCGTWALLLGDCRFGMHD